LVALHGRGESLKGRRRGARGWLDDYQLGRAVSRLDEPPLLESDFEHFVTSDRLVRLNEGLAEHPYAGLIIVCPFLPDVLKGESAFHQTAPLARFVVDVLLPRVYAETPALGTAASTGIDGVSLGGRAALLVGLTRPLAFGSVGGLQAALDEKELGRFSDLAARALEQNPRLVLRLLTSDEDHFLGVNEQLSAILSRKGIRHELTRVIGTHSYRFNRGPGSLEMLIFHNRVLRGWPSP
jgi:enterochelin esterase-like enzyme